MTQRFSYSPLTDQRGAASRILLLSIAGLLVLLACGVAAYFFFLSGHSHKAEAAAHEPPPKPIFVKIDPMTVNLQNSGQVLYIGVSLDVPTQKDADTLTTNMPQVRNRMLIALSDESADKLTTAEGKREVAQTLNKTLSQPYDQTGPVDIKDVLYTNFIVQ